MLSEISQLEKENYQWFYSCAESNEQIEQAKYRQLINREQSDSSGVGVGGGGIKQKKKNIHERGQQCGEYRGEEGWAEVQKGLERINGNGKIAIKMYY